MLALTITLVLAGCTNGVPSDVPDLAYATAEYAVEIVDEAQTTHLIVLLGAPELRSTLGPDGTRGPSWIRTVSVAAQEGNGTPNANTVMRLFGACQDGTTGFCATGVALDADTLLPQRVFLSSLEDVLSGPLEDGSAPSLFWSERSDVGFWEISPLLLGPWLFHGEPSGNLLGREFTTDRKATEGAHLVTYGYQGAFVDPHGGAGAQFSYEVTARFAQRLDPYYAEVRYEEATPDAPPTTVTYTYRLVDGIGSVPLSSSGGSGDAPWAKRSRCADDLKAPLFPTSAHRYADAFEEVQTDPTFQEANERGDTLLVEIERPVLEPSMNPLDPAERFVFAVYMDGEVHTYQVDRPRYAALGSYRVSMHSQAPATGLWESLRDAPCVGVDLAGPRVEAFVAEADADGFRQIFISSAPSMLSFRPHGDGFAPEAMAYQIGVQAYIEAPDGHAWTGPRAYFSLVTGNLTAIFGPTGV